MFRAAVLVPAAPSLLADVTGRHADDLAPVRAAVADAMISLLAATPDRVVVAARAEPGSLAGFGAPLGPLGALGTGGWTHELGVRLLRAAGWTGAVEHVLLDDGVQGDLPASSVAPPGWPALLVLADGSNTRGPRAPGGDDPRGEAFDAAVATRLLAGTGEWPTTAAAVGCSGWAGIQLFAVAAVAGAAEDATPPAATVLYEGAPAGVGYVVAVRPCRQP